MIVAGVLTFLLVVMILRGSSSSSETFEAAYLAKPIGPGEQLTEEHLSYKEVPLATTTEETFLAKDEADQLIKDKETARTVVPVGQPLLSTMFSTPATEDGLRSMSFPVELDHSNAGLVQEGDRIDIVGTATIRETEEDEDGFGKIKNTFSWYVLTDVLVLSTSLEGEAADSGGGALSTGSRTQTVRVAVDDREALMVAASLELSPVFDVVLANGATPVVDEAPLRLTELLKDQGL